MDDDEETDEEKETDGEVSDNSEYYEDDRDGY